jgi:hypothetical protein
MNRILFFLIVAFCTLHTHAQSDHLSEQELKVIKSYQFDISESTPILSDLSLHLPFLQLPESKIEVDLLPVKLDEITLSIMPLAHQVTPSKSYKGYASAGFGNTQILDLTVSYRHQVPNYFMYGLDLNYSNIKDTEILSKERNHRMASGFLRYYLKPTFWTEYSTNYEVTKAGVFGFKEELNTQPGGETRIENYKRNQHSVTLFKSFTKLKTKIESKNTLLSAKNTRMNLGENVVDNQIYIKSELSKVLSVNLQSDHKRQISTINDLDNSFIWNTRLNLSFLKPKFGFKLEGLLSTGSDLNVLPEAEFYINGQSHSLELFYKNDLTLNTFHDNQDEINLISIPVYSSEITETLSYGFEYRFDLKDAHGLSLTGSFVELTNEQVWINNADDPRYFDSHLIDYSFYNLGLKYRINMLSNLEFKQGFHYKHLSDLSPQDIPHFQRYRLKSSVSYHLSRLNFTIDYVLGDQVAFSQNLVDYVDRSGFQHEVDLELKYIISDAVSISILGMDILDNQYEGFAGYKSFGRRGKLQVSTKF